MIDNNHLKNLIKMYSIAPINKFYKPKMSLSLGSSTIEMKIKRKFFHTGQSVHGSVYFKMLDDAAYFASQTHEKEFFLYTVNFEVNFIKTVSKEVIISKGKLLKKSSNKLISKAILYGCNGEEIGYGKGIFVKSNILLKSLNKINN